MLFDHQLQLNLKHWIFKVIWIEPLNPKLLLFYIYILLLIQKKKNFGASVKESVTAFSTTRQECEQLMTKVPQLDKKLDMLDM